MVPKGHRRTSPPHRGLWDGDVDYMTPLVWFRVLRGVLWGWYVGAMDGHSDSANSFDFPPSPSSRPFCSRWFGTRLTPSYSSQGHTHEENGGFGTGNDRVSKTTKQKTQTTTGFNCCRQASQSPRKSDNGTRSIASQISNNKKILAKFLHIANDNGGRQVGGEGSGRGPRGNIAEYWSVVSQIEHHNGVQLIGTTNHCTHTFLSQAETLEGIGCGLLSIFKAYIGIR